MAAAQILLHELEEENNPEPEQVRARRRRSCWSRAWLQRRCLHGQYEVLLGELREHDPRGFQVFQRLSPQVWNELYHKISPQIERRTTMMRPPISAGCRLAITLRFLATGDSYQSHMFGFRVASNTICGIIPDTCTAIFESLSEDYFKVNKLIKFLITLCTYSWVFIKFI